MLWDFPPLLCIVHGNYTLLSMYLHGLHEKADILMK